MAFRKVVVLGGGPIGLMCAIEAASQLKSKFRSSVTLVELRGDYSRMNVPTLKSPVLSHLKALPLKVNGQMTTVAAHAGVDTLGAGQLSAIEKSLHMKAKSVGVKLRQGFKATQIVGKDKRPDGRWKGMAVTISQWDHVNRRIAVPLKTELLQSDLLVVAVGGTSAEEDVYSKVLEFDHSRLQAESYAMYGVFDNDNTTRNIYKEANAEANKLGVIAKLDTTDQRYLLVTLKDMTPADFKILKANAADLRQVMSTVGVAYNNKMLGPLNAASKAVGAFEVKIKRAKHVLSPKFPAMLIGDAAVTPHPETGAGLLTGFHGFEAFRDLLVSLKGVHRSSNEAVDALCAFEDSYEVYIAAKALEGTVVTIEHLQPMVDVFLRDCDRRSSQAKTDTAKKLLQLQRKVAGLLQTTLGEQLSRAKVLGGFLLADTQRINPKITGMDQLSETLQKRQGMTGTLAANDSVQRLWSDLDKTYGYLTQLLGPLSTMDEIMATMEGKITAAGGTVKPFRMGGSAN